ncbi:UDP-glucose 4-epimerase [Rubripirellula amarantea]|uniref:UDP-glucose 4-epimerase n=1 Tax=Rubripirellula amarantea TaxID=2527999 RepID=A0A5C5WR07_9BACT|nr:NAD(P)-dependent oxidoreductase [Rubripirellula amarantea]TWT53246.1 UDP-glucose 4-epimerase [Rubripirellula amarantea]
MVCRQDKVRLSCSVHYTNDVIGNIDGAKREVNIGITGATGFLGHHLIETFAAQGHSIVAWSRDPDTVKLKGKAANADITWIRGRLGDQQASDELARRSDVLIHAAVFRDGDSFIGSEGDPIEYFDVNVTGSMRLLEAASQHEVNRFVFISSGAVHERVAPDRVLDETHPHWPASIYGAYKSSVESMIHAYGWSGRLDACTVRPTSIYGVTDPISKSKWFELVSDVVDGKTVKPTGGGKMVHAHDVAKAAWLCATTDQNVKGETFNTCDRFISHYEVATIAKEITGSKSEIEGDPKQAGNPMNTDKLEGLGFDFGHTKLLRATIADLIKAIQHSRQH